MKDKEITHQDTLGILIDTSDDPAEAEMFRELQDFFDGKHPWRKDRTVIFCQWFSFAMGLVLVALMFKLALG